MVKKRITKHKKYIIDRKQFIKIIKYLRSGKNIANTQNALEVNEKFNVPIIRAFIIMKNTSEIKIIIIS